MSKRNQTFVYACLLLILHIAHVTEEVLGRLFLIDRMGGITVFLAANVIVLSAIVIVLIAFWRGRHWSLTWMKVWAIVELLNGAGHNIAQRLTWFDDLSTAGHVTGIGLFVIAILVLYSLRSIGQTGAEQREQA